MSSSHTRENIWEPEKIVSNHRLSFVEGFFYYEEEEGTILYLKNGIPSDVYFFVPSGL